MENYEQHNEVSTSYNNNNLKHNYNCKDFYQDLEKQKDNYRFKMDENQTTPFSVKDILNNPTYHYEKTDLWKYERDKTTYENDPTYHQSQYCPEYFGQVYPNIPVQNNFDYWTQEMYHDHKMEEYYSYNPYCHNLYHQNYEYAEVPAFHGLEAKVEGMEKEMVSNIDTSSPVDESVEKNREFIVPDLLPKDSPKKNISKLF